MPVKKDKDVYVLLGEEDRPLAGIPDPRRAGTTPSEGAIARRAFEHFLERGGSHGRDVEDWLAAERELRGL